MIRNLNNICGSSLDSAFFEHLFELGDYFGVCRYIFVLLNRDFLLSLLLSDGI